jgi:hypothetical protein
MAPCTRVSVSNWNDYWSFAAIGMPPRDPEDDDEAEDEGRGPRAGGHQRTRRIGALFESKGMSRSETAFEPRAP